MHAVASTYRITRLPCSLAWPLHPIPVFTSVRATSMKYSIQILTGGIVCTQSTAMHIILRHQQQADRLLELGFETEVEELVRNCPTGRQTLLFSATMNTKVEGLVKLTLNRPVRVVAAKPNTLAQRLVQEFIRIRSSREVDRSV
jgi:hypothetical protein